MKILFVCMEYDYGNPLRGKSYEYFNIYQSLISIGHDVCLFDYSEELSTSNKEEMNKKLFNLVVNDRPQVTLFSIFNDELDPFYIKKLSKYTKTLCFFYDDTWRIDYTKKWANYFDFFTTPDYFGKCKYELLGLNNSLHFPFGCNENIYHKLNQKKKYDVSFVGAWHPYREWIIKRLRKLDISVKVAGYGWPDGIVEHQEMVKIFNQSKINLNLSNSISWDIRYLFSSPRAFINTVRSTKNNEQIKARHFEINGCGGFQLTYYVSGLEKYYEIGKEIDVYLDVEDLEKKVLFHLKNNSIREKVSQAGYERTINDHLFKDRFKLIFNQMGLLK